MILIHRLRKNHVPARDYLLMTDTYVRLGGLQPGNVLEEDTDGLDPVRVHWLPASHPA